MSDDILKTLERDGIVVLRDLIEPSALDSMQKCFQARLTRLRMSNVDGYERSELFRQMVSDVLTLDQGFVDLALHPAVVAALEGYLGPHFRLTEAKGWRSLTTRRSFHGWHGDAWYDQQAMGGIPREVKLALYLTDVTSGEFQYLRGTHQKQHPRMVFDEEIDDAESALESVKGRAGTAFLFDTSGIHRQAEPMLEDRMAVFYAYHDPRVPLQAEDVAYHRYHPLILNAAFLGDLTEEQQRILGFGDPSNYRPAFQRELRFPGLHRSLEQIWLARLHADDLLGRIRARLSALGKRGSGGR